jgi:hypothetical protein
MKSNIGTFDRILRITVGLFLIIATTANLIGVWGWIGIIPLATGLFSFCPMYSVLGIRSCGVKTDAEEDASGV